MFFQESELFRGVEERAMNEISNIMILENLKEGSVLFTPQDPANNFFILYQGRVRLDIGDQAKIDYMVSRRGEVFGWSGLVDRELYYARAECVEPSKIYKINKEELERIFEKYPASGMMFYRRLAGAVVQRLLYSYETSLRQGSFGDVTSFGTRQVMAAGED